MEKGKSVETVELQLHYMVLQVKSKDKFNIKETSESGESKTLVVLYHSLARH